jgi:hypothetical protein
MRLPTNPAGAPKRDAYDCAQNHLSECAPRAVLARPPWRSARPCRIADFRNPGGDKVGGVCFPRLLAMPRRLHPSPCWPDFLEFPFARPKLLLPGRIFWDNVLAERSLLSYKTLEGVRQTSVGGERTAQDRPVCFGLTNKVPLKTITNSTSPHSPGATAGE